MPFRYIRDPLFLLCLAVYPLNRYVLKSIWDGGFVHDYLNDLICIPFLVPIMLYVERKLGLRKDDAIPQWYEVMIPVIVLSLFFEVLLPLRPIGGKPFVADHLDVLCYVIGALIAALFWNYWYDTPAKPAAAASSQGQP